IGTTSARWARRAAPEGTAHRRSDLDRGRSCGRRDKARAARRRSRRKQMARPAAAIDRLEISGFLCGRDWATRTQPREKTSKTSDKRLARRRTDRTRTSADCRRWERRAIRTVAGRKELRTTL